MLLHFLLSCFWNTVKLLNFGTQEKLAVINKDAKPLNRVFHQKDANGKENSENPDQTAPLGAV